MALERNELRQNLEYFWGLTPSTPFPPTRRDAAQFWSRAISNYCRNIEPQSINIKESEDILYLNLLSVFNNPISVGEVGFANSLNAFASDITVGMSNDLRHFPPKNFPIESLKDLVNQNLNREEILDKFVDTIHDWFKTGFSEDNNTGMRTQWS